MTERQVAKQRTAALARANEIRAQRKVLKVGLKSGRVSLEQAMAEPALATMPTIKLANELPWHRTTVGKASPTTNGRLTLKARTMLRQAGVPPLRAVGLLTDRQRERLVEWWSAREARRS